MSIVKQLNQLQEIERAIDGLNKEIAAIEAQLSGNEAIVKSRNEIAALEQQIAEIRKVQRDNGAETADVSAKIEASEKELYDGKTGNPKELVNLQIEIDGLKSRRSEFEAKEIEVIEQLDGLNGALSKSQADLARMESEWQGLRLELSKKLEDLKIQLAALTQRREQTLATIPPDAVACYVRVKKQKKDSIAVARIEQGICRGCRIQLPAREIQQARGNRIVQCSSCGRILFMP